MADWVVGRPFRIAVIAVWMLTVGVWLAGSGSMAQEKWKPYETFDFRHRTLTPAQLAPLSLTDLKYLRGLVFGRHGRVFGEPLIQDFLKTRPWYHPSPSYHVTDLNPVERRNMDVIKEAEWKKHTHIEPGDLRFVTSQTLTAQRLGHHSILEWRIMAAEIEAWHGKSFDDQPWLQQYFAERYWYHPDTHYDARLLSKAERANLETIQKIVKRQEGVALAPGDMGLFTDSPISAAMLHGLGLYDLRLLRNEVFARHGLRFRTAWLQHHFMAQPWYQLTTDGPVALSSLEKRNVAVILTAESALHRDLSIKPLAPATLAGLSADDARKLRNEIYARHGKVFRDSWLRGYFGSLPWYRPDSHFTETSLSKIEQANAARILAYENRGRTQMQTMAA